MRYHERMYITIIFIFAFLLRLINLNQSLWLDETIVAKVVKTIPFHLIPFQFSPGDFHPPLYYLVISLWTRVFGTSEIALRLPSIIFSLLTGWFVYKIGLLLKNKQTALWATVFFLFNPLIIYYSQEARMYMMATMFLTIALYYFLRICLNIIPVSSVIPAKAGIQAGKENYIDPVSLHGMTMLFNLFSALAMFTFYGSTFFIAGMIIVGTYQLLVIHKRKKNPISLFFHLFIGLFISLILLSPLLYQQMMNAKGALVDVKNWSLVLGKAEMKNVLMIFLKFATGRLSWYPKWSYYLVAGIPTAITWLLVILGMKKNKLFGYLFILPLLFGLFVSFWAPMMMYFRFIYLIPVMSLLLAEMMQKHTQIFGYIVLFSYCVFSLAYLLFPQFHREDWKGLTRQLNNDTRVYMILPSSDPISYYKNDISVFELRDIKKNTVAEFITVIPYTSEIYGFNYQQILQEKGCTKKSQTQFRGDLSFEEWICLRKA